jgi:spermidine/putrescine transport system substrate-binding protein
MNLVKKFAWILLGLGAVFFVSGIGWGIWTHKRRVEDLAKAVPLRVLCAENWISDAALEKFSREHNVPIKQWTYTRPSDFLRQLANADGKVDVLCTSSLLVKSLVRSHWLKKMNFQSLPNAKLLAVDFEHLPYDPDSEYSAPLFWTLYGFFGKEPQPKIATWKQTWQSKKVSLWGDELNILQLVTKNGVNVEQRLQEEEAKPSKSVEDDIRRFTKAAAHILKPDAAPVAADAMTEKVDWVLLPLAKVASALGQDSPFHFWLPEDGATLELGVLGVGEKSAQPELAMRLINELISTDEAMASHERLGMGVVHSSLSNLASIAALQKPSALREFPLNRLRFPDLSVESLPRFQKIFDEITGVDAKTAEAKSRSEE